MFAAKLDELIFQRRCFAPELLTPREKAVQFENLLTEFRYQARLYVGQIAFELVEAFPSRFAILSHTLGRCHVKLFSQAAKLRRLAVRWCAQC